ncbi:hypothetical protein GCM10027039_01440 [Terrabacter koreensis]
MRPARQAPDLAVSTPWYPTPYNPVGGSFVADWSALGRRLLDGVHVYHSEEWPGGTEANVAKWAADTDRVFGTVARRGGFDVTGRCGPITRVPTVITSGWDVPQRALAAVEAARRYAVGLDESPLVHGHVGYLGGLVGARLKHPDARLVVTEHSTGLADVLASDLGRDLYDEVLGAAHRLTCVSDVVRRQIVEVFPQHADTVVVVPNPVNFQPEFRRTSPPGSLDRWVFGGGLIERKGVTRLTEAFCRFALGRPGARLDLFGSGPLEPALRARVSDAGLDDRVTFHGNVGHAEFLAALPEHDVLLAPSTHETFHLVVPEAVAAGLPVVVTRSGGPEEALAGVADRVGRFIDVSDDPDELAEAVLDLEERLGDLDLDGGRAELDRRYGTAAVTRELAALYGLEPGRESGSVAAISTAATAEQPSRPVADSGPVTLLSASGWRRYAIEAESEAAARADLPVSVVTADAGVRELLSGVARIVEPHAFLDDLPRNGYGARDASAEGPSVRTRARTLLRSALGARRGRAADPGVSGDPAESVPPEHAAWPRSTYVLTHVSGAAWAAALLNADPAAEVVIELDRPRLGLAPVDAP